MTSQWFSVANKLYRKRLTKVMGAKFLF